MSFGEMFSPGIIALVILALGNKINPKQKVIYFLLGDVLVALILGYIGFAIGKGIISITKPGNIFDIIFGIILILFGLKSIFFKDKHDENHAEVKKEENKSGNRYLLWFLLGFVINITNFDAAMLYLTSLKEIGEAAMSDLEKTIAILICAIFYLSPALIPYLIYLMFPEKSQSILEKINKKVIKYGRYLLGIIFLGFGIYLLYKGL